MSTFKHTTTDDQSNPAKKLHFPFALPIIQGKKLKKKCCKKFKKGKRCGRCPNG